MAFAFCLLFFGSQTNVGFVNAAPDVCTGNATFPTSYCFPEHFTFSFLYQDMTGIDRDPTSNMVYTSHSDGKVYQFARNINNESPNLFVSTAGSTASGSRKREKRIFVCCRERSAIKNFWILV